MRLLLVRGLLSLGATRIGTPHRGRRCRPFAIRLLTWIRRSSPFSWKVRRASPAVQWIASGLSGPGCVTFFSSLTVVLRLHVVFRRIDGTVFVHTIASPNHISRLDLRGITFNSFHRFVSDFLLDGMFGVDSDD